MIVVLAVKPTAVGNGEAGCWLSIAIFASEKSIRLHAWTYHALVWDGPVFLILMTAIVNYGQEWWYRAIVM